MDRDSVKFLFMRDVIAKRGRYPSEVEDVFRRCFPSIHEMIKAINRDDHATLIRLLQRMESTLVIESVAPRLVDQIPIVTLHDAIYARRQDTGLVAAAFRATFDDLGFEMKLKVES